MIADDWFALLLQQVVAEKSPEELAYEITGENRRFAKLFYQDVLTVLGALNQEKIMDDPLTNCQNALNLALEELKKAKPETRSESARRFAVTITELEKVIGYFETWIVNRPAA